MKKIYKSKNARKNLRKIETLKKVSENGKIFSVSFIKKDGSIRNMTCRKGVKKYLKGGKNTVSHISKYVTIYSINDKGYRNINTNTLKQVKGSGKIYTFK